METIKNNTMKIFLILLIGILGFIHNINAQLPAGASVLFADGKWYTARVISESTDRIKMEFLHSYSIYEFGSDGKIISSTGQYPKGQKVKEIGVRDKLKSVYNQSSVGKRGDILGIKFSDGQVYFCGIEESVEAYFTCTFMHTKSIYAMKREGNSWLVYASDKGKYPIGHKLADIYTLGSRRIFYSDGGNYFGGIQGLAKEN